MVLTCLGKTHGIQSKDFKTVRRFKQIASVSTKQLQTIPINDFATCAQVSGPSIRASAFLNQF